MMKLSLIAEEAMAEVSRTGRQVMQPAGYRAFIPAALPYDPPLRYAPGLLALLSEADQELARLDAATEFLPNPDLFVRMYVRKEAVLSSQIEGTQASLVDVLEHEAHAARAGAKPVTEVVNYVRAMNLGLERLATLPLSLRLLREIHAELLRGARGSERTPGEFRRSQNWIGPERCSLAEARYVPPPPDEANAAMGDLERFLHDGSPLPILVRAALVHAQFETIHPFLDGNGRVGRLLITFLLCARGVLRRPMLYLSYDFKRRRQEYYDRLQAVRDTGDVEGWVWFFLEGVRDVAREGTDTARRILRLREEHRILVTAQLKNSTTGIELLDSLFERPVVTVQLVQDLLGRSYPAANDLIAGFVNLGLLREITGGARNRVFQYDPYVAIFGELKP
jgi:Fic family protein